MALHGNDAFVSDVDLQKYRTIKFDYLSKRLSESGERICNLLFELIVDKKINGAIHI